jgi:predicted transcriptional regulator
MGLEFFANERFEILILLKENEIKVKEDEYVPLSQQEIADMAHFSKLKTNKILNELINLDYVVPYMNKRGKYALTEKGNKLIELFKNTNL